jgi:hypothetical protein
MRIDVYVHATDDPVTSLLTKVMAALQKMEQMMSDLTDKVDKLTSDVADLPTIAQSVEALVDGLNAIIADLKNSTVDPAVLAKIDAANAAIETAKAQLVAAVQRGTPTA